MPSAAMCHLLQCAEATVCDAVDHLTLNDRSLVYGAGQHIETARALIDAVLDGVGVIRIFDPH
ncbi:hypothetical protein [Pseudomonas fluorescens]|uniref:hypothetical protein n=1 Tax=Pseudomonas fluorescens TaxID=294 RepID=UPI00178471D8|nr:hypothetical protein [Pseudomonas fluorescens]